MMALALRGDATLLHVHRRHQGCSGALDEPKRGGEARTPIPGV